MATRGWIHGEGEGEGGEGDQFILPIRYMDGTAQAALLGHLTKNRNNSEKYTDEAGAATYTYTPLHKQPSPSLLFINPCIPVMRAMRSAESAGHRLLQGEITTPKTAIHSTYMSTVRILAYTCQETAKVTRTRGGVL